MFFLFGFASIPLAYLTSLKLKKPSSGFALLVIIYLLTGLILVMAMGIIELVYPFKGLDTVLIFARFLPVFSMSFGIKKLYKVGSYQKACKDTLKVYLDARCRDQYLRKSDPFWGCCPERCSKNKECYDQMDPLRWDENGMQALIIITHV